MNPNIFGVTIYENGSGGIGSLCNDADIECS